MSKKRVSVVIATFNGERYIKQQLESVIFQSRRPDEVVICDDMSMDKTVDYILEIAALHPTIDFRLYQNEVKLGCYRNFEKGILLSTGDFIFLCDQDDVWFPDKVQAHMEKYQTYNLASVINNCEFADENLLPLGLSKIDSIRAKNAKLNFVQGCCLSITAPVRNLAIPFPKIEGLSHDEWLFFCCIKVGERYIDERIHQLYRRHSSNVSKSSINLDKNISLIKRILSLTHYKHIVKQFQIEHEIFMRLDRDDLHQYSIATTRYKYVIGETGFFYSLFLYVKRAKLNAFILDTVRKIRFEFKL